MKPRNNKARIYLPPKPAPNRGKYELYVDGETTGKLLTFDQIRQFLTRKQFNDFHKGFEIFMVNRDILNFKENNITRKRYIKGLK